ncbi:MAG: hypothetical protein ACRD9L_13200 [Bryobacteraceae bacterium]
MEEGTPMVPAHRARSYTFVPRPSMTRWYHTHIAAKRDLKRSTFTSQFGFLYVEPKNEPGPTTPRCLWRSTEGTGTSAPAGMKTLDWR